MLLRIDDIVSGISKKSKGGPSGPTGTQTEDHDNVSAMHARASCMLVCEVCCYLLTTAETFLRHLSVVPGGVRTDATRLGSAHKRGC